MRTDRRIQELVLEMVVGRPYRAEIYKHIDIESKSMIVNPFQTTRSGTSKRVAFFSTSKKEWIRKGTQST